jgi:hypothetical protein
MTEWVTKSWTAVYKAGGRELQLEVVASTIPKATAWYWSVVNEEGKVVRSGCHEEPGTAKSAATKAAKAYIRRPR